MEILPAWVAGLEISRAFESQGGLVRRPQIRGSTQNPGDVLRENVEPFSRRFPPRDALCVSRKRGEILVPPGWEFAALHQVDLGREFGVLCSIRPNQHGPFGPGLRTAGAHAV